MLFIDGDVNGIKSIWMQRAGVLNCASRGAIDFVDEYNDGMTLEDGGGGSKGRVFCEFGLFRLVLVIEADDDPYEDWDHHKDYPRAVKEFGCANDHRNDRSHYRSNPINQEPGPPSLLLQADVATGHARLGQGETEEYADCIKRDEATHAGAKNDDEYGSHSGERQNSVAVHQSMTAFSQLSRHE